MKSRIMCYTIERLKFNRRSMQNMSHEKNNKTKGLMALGGLAVLTAVTLLGSDPLYNALSSMNKPSIYTPGTYESSSQGYGGPVNAAVTVSDKEITAVMLTGENETEGIGKAALEVLPEQFKAAQSAGVDVVAGATVTSSAAKEAVGNALKKAKGEAVTETTAAAEEIPVVAVNTSGHLFNPGTYKAKAAGMHELEVEVVVSEDAIESVEILHHEETQGISDAALTQIPKDILEAQGLGVDAIAGATLTSGGIIRAVTDCLEQAGGDVEGLKLLKKPEQQKVADQEYTADVIVIGGGGAGLAAAVTANQEGASVIVLEKMPKVGGNTILAGGALNAVDDGSETALVNGDSVQKHYDQTMSGGDNQGDPDLVRTLVENAWDGVEWLKSLGMEFREGVFTVTGGLWPRAHKPVEPVGTGFFKTYNQYIEEHDGVEVMLNTEAVDIRKGESGTVNTVIAKGKTGNTLTFHAEKAVIVATGGFSRNVELREKYNTQWPSLDENIKSTNHTGASGDAIPMLEKLGAEFVQMENIQLLPLGDPETGSLSGNIEFDVERRIFVNKNGDRFVNEGGRRDDMTLALFEQPDTYMWIIMDSDCYPTGDELNNFNESVNDLIAQGRAVKGDSLEELAERMNVSAENLIAAVEDFNTHAEDKSTDDFGRTLYSTLIDTPPYYAAPRVPTVHHTMGGVKINTKAEVLGIDGSSIPGLYAAGEVTGGIHGANRLGGNALTDTVVFGRIAGKEAAHYGETAVAGTTETPETTEAAGTKEAK